MKTQTYRAITLTLLFTVVAFCSTGCVSAGLLRLGTTSDKVFGDYKTPNSREQVESYLGAPVLVKPLSTLPTKEDFFAFWNQLGIDGRFGRTHSDSSVYFDNLATIQKRSRDSQMKNGHARTARPFLYARYNHRGRIITGSLIDEHIGVCVWTLGIWEPIQFPRALWILATGHNRLNYISVWYDDGGRVVAYAWAWHDFSVPSPADAPEQKQTDSQELKTFWNLP